MTDCFRAGAAAPRVTHGRKTDISAALSADRLPIIYSAAIAVAIARN